jgi:hypothetical protein
MILFWYNWEYWVPGMFSIGHTCRIVQVKYHATGNKSLPPQTGHAYLLLNWDSTSLHCMDGHVPVTNMDQHIPILLNRRDTISIHHWPVADNVQWPLIIWNNNQRSRTNYYFSKRFYQQSFNNETVLTPFLE